MDITTVELTEEGTYVVNGRIFVYSERQAEYQEIQDWISAGNAVIHLRPTIQVLKSNKKRDLELQAEELRQSVLGANEPAKQLVYMEKEAEAERILQHENPDSVSEIFPWANAEAPLRNKTLVELASEWKSNAAQFKAAGIAIETAYVLAKEQLSNLPDDDTDDNREAIRNLEANWPSI